MKRKEMIAAYEQGPQAVVKLVETLLGVIREFVREVAGFKKRVASLEEDNQELKERLAELEARLKMNSRNSSKPPSSDGPAKPLTKKRGRTGRSPGGQEGHEGHTLTMVDDPHHIITHSPEKCSRCGCSLEDVEPGGHERRQVFDIPRVPLEVTEHRCQVKTCPECGRENKAAFPAGVDAPVQYGVRVKSLIVYLLVYQLIPLKRACELIFDLFGHGVSQATLVKVIREAHRTLEPAEEEIKRRIIQARVACFDETGTRSEGKTSWLHVSSTGGLTHYAVHPKRGCVAMNEIGILPDFRGIAVHDGWKPYGKYRDCTHALCNAHHLRELTFLFEEQRQDWAGEMNELLRDIYASCEDARARGRKKLSKALKGKFDRRYEQILSRGMLANPLPEPPRNQPKKRGKVKKSKARNLLERLRDRKDEVLLFMYDFQAPFDNVCTA